MAGHSLFVRILWFLVVGWWATPVVIGAAWLCNATIVLIPIGIKIINFVPTVQTLREPLSVTDPESAPEQSSLPVRAIYFVFVGWWLSLLWAAAASAISITIVGLPIAVWMLDRLPYVTSLYRFR